MNRPISVLYVDDDPDLLELGKMFLERSGTLQVDTCPSAAEAIERLKHLGYDIIISDYQMPEIDGLEFLIRIRNAHNDIPFILFTGRGREEVVINALNHGADFYLQKGGPALPQFTELEHKVKQAVRKIRSESRIRESEERYRTLFARANDAILLLKDGIFIDCNQKAIELFCRTSGGILGSAPEDLSPDHQPDGSRSRDRNREILDQVLSGAPRVFPWRYSRPDGTFIDVEASITRLDLSEQEILLVIIRDISERVRMESALRESAQLMTDIISFLPDATFAVNNDGRVIAWNNAMEELTGIGKDEIIGMGDYEYALPFYGERRPVLVDLILTGDESISNRYKDLQRKGDKLISEFYSPHIRKGKGAHLWFIASPLIDTRGMVIGAIESLRDITDERNREFELRASYEQVAAMEEELRSNYDKLAARQRAVAESEVKYRSLFSAMVEGHALNEVIYDEEGRPADYRIIEVNPAFEKIFGISRINALGKTSNEAFGKIDHAGLRRYTRVAETGMAENIEIWYPPMEKHFAISIYSPKKGQFATVFEDVTQRRHDAHELRAAYEQITAVEEELRNSFEELAEREQALRTSEEHYRRIVETANEGIWAVDRGLKTTFANPRLAAMFGYTVEEMQGMPMMGFIPDDDLNHHDEHAYKRKAGSRATYERRFRKKNGEYLWCHVAVTPLVTANGEFDGSFAMLTDITARKTAEDELRKLNDELNTANEQMAALLEEVQSTGEALAARNRELEEKSRALETSEESLLQANRKLNLLNSLTRHDILNQLTSLFGFLELVQEEVTDLEIQKYLEREKRAAETIKDQIEFTRDYQDIGIQTPEWQNVHEVITNAAATVSLKDVGLSVDVGEVEIFADHLLRKVFFTLIENAMRHGGTINRLHFSLEPSPDQLKIICEDNGIGIPPEAKEKIFQRKYFQNTGLGLFLSQEILSITGLKMIETGTYGKGSRFEILVPKSAFRGFFPKKSRLLGESLSGSHNPVQ